LNVTFHILFFRVIKIVTVALIAVEPVQRTEFFSKNSYRFIKLTKI